MKRAWGIAAVGVGCILLLAAVVRVPESQTPHALAPHEVEGTVVTELERLEMPARAPVGAPAGTDPASD